MANGKPSPKQSKPRKKTAKTARRKKVIPGVETDDQPRIFRFTIDGESRTMDVNPDHMPVRDRIAVEEFLGMPWVEAAVSGWLASQKSMAYLAYLCFRRDDETLSFEDVLEASELSVEEVEDHEDPSKTHEDSGAQS